jgi:HAD superfamily hydrolase (TIGR01509 family)
LDKPALDKTEQLRTLIEQSSGIIFDFDGLLADSEKYHYLSYSEVFATYGHTIDQTEYYKYWTSLGLGAKGEIDRFGLDLDPVRIKEEKNPIFSRYCEDGSIKLYPQAKEMIDLFHRVGKRLAIASGTTSTDIRAVLRNAGVTDCFEAILGSDIVPAVKPAPDVFLAAARRMDLEPNRCLVLEDAEKGMFAAMDAGMPVIIILTRETKDFDFSRADLVSESTTEFVSLLERVLPV